MVKHKVYGLLSFALIAAWVSGVLIFPANASNPQSTVAYSNSTGPVVSATLTGTTGGDKAVYGYASGSSGSTYGVYGKSNSGRGVYGEGLYEGVWGKTTSKSGTGVRGDASASSGSTYGVWGQSNSTSGTGVYGISYVYGVYGQAAVSSGYGVYSKGKFAATGTKSAIVRTSNGPTEMYSEEAAEVWFSDYGIGKLVNGRAHVELDADFLETVTVNERNPLHVFVQLRGEANNVYVVDNLDAFDVIETSRGKSNAAFSYRVVAKRSGYEDTRMKIVDVDLDHGPGDELPVAVE